MERYVQEFNDFMRVEKNYSDHTVRGYQADILDYIAFTEIADPNEITKSNIRRYLSYLSDKSLEATTRNHKLSSIRSFCKFLSDEGHIAHNPAIEIQTAKTEQKLPAVMSIPQVNTIIDSVENARDKAILEILYGSGLRVSELIKIKLRDIDNQNCTVRVLYAKGSKQRITPLSSVAKDAILDYISQAGITDENQYLFPSPVKVNSHITDRAVRNIVYKYSNNSTSPHKFRHSCATHLLAGGMDLRYIQEILGHSDINTTTIYAKVSIDNLSRNYHLAHPRG